MKKFSKVSGFDVVSTPIVTNDKTNEYNDIRDLLMGLIDNSLRVTSYGSARHEILQTTKISGKEMLVESLINMFKDKEVATKVKALEVLKESVKDWESIDASIDNMLKAKECFTFLVNNDDSVRKLVQFMQRTTEESFEPLTDILLEKYSPLALDHNVEVIHNMIISGHYDNNMLAKLSDKFQKYKSTSDNE